MCIPAIVGHCAVSCLNNTTTARKIKVITQPDNNHESVFCFIDLNRYKWYGDLSSHTRSLHAYSLLRQQHSQIELTGSHM